MSCDVGALSVLVQEQLVVRTIHCKIVRPWPEQGELVHCTFNMLPTCGVGEGGYYMHFRSVCVCVTNSKAYLYLCHIDYIHGV